MYQHGDFYLSFLFLSKLHGKNLSKSQSVIFAAFNTRTKLCVDGQRGKPFLLTRLLLLNVVAFNPAKQANPEQDMFKDFAKFIIPSHKSLFVIKPPLV